MNDYKRGRIGRKTPSVDVSPSLLAVHIFDLRKAGWNWTEIAAELKTPYSQVIELFEAIELKERYGM